jgi:hypothetical protein
MFDSNNSEKQKIDQTTRMQAILISNSSEDSHSSDDRQRSVKDMRVIEPKSVFANERTLLHYVQKSCFLLAVGVGLARSSRLYGPPIALVCTMYLQKIFREFAHRKNVILSRQAVEKFKSPAESRLDVRLAPWLAALLVMLGALLSFINSSFLA